MMTFPIPDSALAQHTAILGKTGSGKTSTGKLVVEHVVDLGERVCILDPIKSDWWGLTSSADGKRPGLPFQVLGGPHGHVPLHDGAGAAIAELVATGALPLSIIDMADFGPGGQARFFVDFAPVLLRRMRGVLRLVVGEAHLFAPKERSGLGSENMAIHWAKVLATAGRSKGIRLVVETQSVQQLHNRVLGSCENLVAMRLTAPADQKPVIDWLKANAPKDVEAQIRTSLASLKTGTGWLCSGEAGIFQRVAFPRIRTFDNSATPEHGDDAHHVVQAQVDQQQLRALIGDAVAEAEANDPKRLKARIAELERAATSVSEKINTPGHTAVPAGYTEEYVREREALGERNGYERAREQFSEALAGVILAIQQTGATIAGEMERLETSIEKVDKETFRAENPAKGNQHQPLPTENVGSLKVGQRVVFNGKPATVTASSSSLGNSGKRRILVALAQKSGGVGMAPRKLSLLTGISQKGGTWRTYMADLRSRGWIEGREAIRITVAGAKALGDYEPLPTGQALIEYWRDRLGDSGKRKIFDVVVGAYPRAVPKGKVSEATGISLTGGTWRTYLAELRGLELIEGRDELCAAAELFE